MADEPLGVSSVGIGQDAAAVVLDGGGVAAEDVVWARRLPTLDNI